MLLPQLSITLPALANVYTVDASTASYQPSSLQQRQVTEDARGCQQPGAAIAISVMSVRPLTFFKMKMGGYLMKIIKNQ